VPMSRHLNPPLKAARSQNTLSRVDRLDSVALTRRVTCALVFLLASALSQFGFEKNLLAEQPPVKRTAAAVAGPHARLGAPHFRPTTVAQDERDVSPTLIRPRLAVRGSVPISSVSDHKIGTDSNFSFEVPSAYPPVLTVPHSMPGSDLSTQRDAELPSLQRQEPSVQDGFDAVPEPRPVQFASPIHLSAENTNHAPESQLSATTTSLVGKLASRLFASAPEPDAEAVYPSLPADENLLPQPLPVTTIKSSHSQVGVIRTPSQQQSAATTETTADSDMLGGHSVFTTSVPAVNTPLSRVQPGHIIAPKPQTSEVRDAATWQTAKSGAASPAQRSTPESDNHSDSQPTRVRHTGHTGAAPGSLPVPFTQGSPVSGHSWELSPE
jgi:hypothetical protein